MGLFDSIDCVAKTAKWKPVCNYLPVLAIITLNV